MSSFVDSKEEVVKLELTVYGKKLLAQGQFKPHYYAFFDNGVEYDARNSESQNDIQDRILDNVLANKLTNISLENLSASLGNSSVTSSYSPAWDINLLHGTCSYVSGSSTYESKQFNLSDINYSVELKEKTNTALMYDMSNFELDDGTILDISNDYLLLDLQELNVDGGYKNFDIEIFVENELKLDKLDRLMFYDKQSNIIDGILYSEDELPLASKTIQLSKENSEFYLDILVDEEIDSELITGAIKIAQDEVKGTYTNTFTGPVEDEC
jgi:hypothetical protein